MEIYFLWNEYKCGGTKEFRGAFSSIRSKIEWVVINVPTPPDFYCLSSTVYLSILWLLFVSLTPRNQQFIFQSTHTFWNEARVSSSSFNILIAIAHNRNSIPCHTIYRNQPTEWKTVLFSVFGFEWLEKLKTAFQVFTAMNMAIKSHNREPADGHFTYQMYTQIICRLSERQKKSRCVYYWNRPIKKCAPMFSAQILLISD